MGNKEMKMSANSKLWKAKVTATVCCSGRGKQKNMNG